MMYGPTEEFIKLIQEQVNTYPGCRLVWREDEGVVKFCIKSHIHNQSLISEDMYFDSHNNNTPNNIPEAIKTLIDTMT